MKSDRISGTVVVLVAVLLFNAIGLSAGQAQNYLRFLPREGSRCASPQDLLAALESEGHRFVAAMERLTVNVDTGETQPLAQFMTVTADGGRFYVLEANVPLGVPNGVFCITATGRDLEVNDYRQERPPQVTRFAFDPADAAAACELLERETEGLLCGHRDTILGNANSQNGMRLALQGTLVAENGDDFALLTVIADPIND